MQDQIREVPQEEFSTVKRFIDLKNNMDLASTEETAAALLNIIRNRDTFQDVILDVRNLN
jgi:hypothetical protein